MAWKKVSKDLAELLDQALSAYPAQKRIMFGCPAYFVNGNMFAGAHQDSLLIRLPAAERETLLSSSDEVTQFEPMAGRPMKEYLVLPEFLYADQAELHKWLKKSYSYASALPPKMTKRKKSK